MLLGFDEFLQIYLMMRSVWIRGIVGTGKTLLAVAMADYLFRNRIVDGVIANLPTIFPPWIGKDTGDLNRRAVIFDEAWTHLDARTSIVNPREYGAYSRKLESFYIYPSVIQVDKRVRPLIVNRLYNWWFFGKRIWEYEWQIGLDYGEPKQGKFWLYDPSKFYGWFATRHIPVDDGGIQDRWSNSIYDLTHGEGVKVGPDIVNYLSALESVVTDA